MRPHLHRAGRIGASVEERERHERDDTAARVDAASGCAAPTPASARPEDAASVISTFHASGENTPATAPCSALTMKTPSTISDRLRTRTCRQSAAGASPRRDSDAKRQRNRHPRDEQERREDGVGDRHPVVPVRRVQQPGRSARDAGHLVDEEHQQDVEAAQDVDRQQARRANGEGATRAAWGARQGSGPSSKDRWPLAYPSFRARAETLADSRSYGLICPGPVSRSPSAACSRRRSSRSSRWSRWRSASARTPRFSASSTACC